MYFKWEAKCQRMFQRTLKKLVHWPKQEVQISQDAVIAENFEKDDFYEKP